MNNLNFRAWLKQEKKAYGVSLMTSDKCQVSEQAAHETHHAVTQARDALVVKPAIEKRIPASAHSMLAI